MKQLNGILFLIGFSCAFSDLRAQNIEWQNTISGNLIDVIISMDQTADKGYILGCKSDSDSSLDKTENSNGENDFWIIKLDETGNIQWQNTIGGDSSDYLFTIQQTTDGGYICGGRSDSNLSGDKSENSMGNDDYWIVKLDSSGSIEWQNTIGSIEDDWFESLDQTFDGGYIVAGWSWGDISGDKTEPSQGLRDYWILKLNATGNIQWQKSIGGSNGDLLSSIRQTSDSGFICGGYSVSPISGDKTENPRGQEDYWIVKLDSLGNVMWDKTIGGDLHDNLNTIIQTNDGGYICGGISTSNLSGDKTEICQGDYDCFLVKLNSNGVIEWQNTIGGDSYDHLSSIQQISNGSYILGGWSFSAISGDKIENGNLSDFWIINLSNEGIIQWQNSIGGSSFEILYIAEQTVDGGFICAGGSTSIISGDKTENSVGWDCWIVKLDGRYNLIQGEEFVDYNVNNIRDVNEPPVQYSKISEVLTGQFAFTDYNGFYSVSVSDSGAFLVEPESINYYSSSPLNHNIYFNGIMQIDAPNDFARQPAGSFNDLCISITPNGIFRTGMASSYVLNYINNGTTTINATVIFYPDSNIFFVSSIPSASVITQDSITYYIGTLLPFQSGQIIVAVSVNTGLPIGTVLNSGAAIFPIAGDINPGCNIDYIETFIMGSLDPNDIVVNKDSLFISELITPEPLEYIIRFQNTGNDTAFYVRVDNKISADLQLNTFEFVASSHPCNIEYQNYDSTMKFTFNNILLPDSNINESASHGFVRYKIKPQTSLQIGDSVRNSAGIYFDYNAPVWTNTAVTEIVLSTGLSQQLADDNIQLLVYPNPVNQVLSVEIVGTSENNFIIDLYNMYGQKVNSLFNGKIPLGNRKIHFDVSELRSGMYFIKAEGSFSKPVRFIKY